METCIWHPFTQMMTTHKPISIIKGKGTYLYAEDGNPYLDGIASWWVNLHGHAHPYIVERIHEQASTLEHVIFADFTHPSAIELAQRLIRLYPGQFSKVFYSDNGSTAVEVAIKMAFQYWYNQNATNPRKKIICFKGSYHGETFGAMSASGKNEIHKPFWKYLFDVEMIDPPWDEEHSISQLKHLVKSDDIACFIFEPLILGVSGMRSYPAKGLNALMKICKEHDILMIADEVLTGFGRTGYLFACEGLEEKPDIVCLSKGLTGGFVPLGVTLCKERVYNAFLSDDLSKALLHGHSYTGNPIACQSALASLDLLEMPNSLQQREMIKESHQRFCQKWKDHPSLIRCECLGVILAIEYKVGNLSYFSSFRDTLYRHFLKHYILLRPLGNVIYVLPPYCITFEELSIIYDHIIRFTEEYSYASGRNKF